MFFEPNLAARSQLLLAIVEKRAELSVSKVLAEPLHEDHIVLGLPYHRTKFQGIALVCLTNFDARLLFGMLDIVHVAIHDVNRIIREVLTQGRSNPATATTKVEECPSSLAALASSTDRFEGSHRISNVVVTYDNSIVGCAPYSSFHSFFNQMVKGTLLCLIWGLFKRTGRLATCFVFHLDFTFSLPRCFALRLKLFCHF